MDRVYVGEVRSEGRIIAGTVMAYGELSPTHRERFLPGSLIRSGHVWLDLEHDQRAVVTWEGAGLEFAETAEALTMRAAIPRTVPGDMALQGVRDGTRAGLSVEFEALHESREAQTGVRVIERARLAGVGLVERPSYEGSRVELRQRTGPTVSGRVALGARLSCQCRTDCDAVRINPQAFDRALREAEAGEREIVAFLSGRFDTPLARLGEGLWLTRSGRQLRVELDGLPEGEAVAEFLESVRNGVAFQARPYWPDRSSDVERVGATSVVSRADLRGIELAPITGPTFGLQRIEVGEQRRRRRGRRLWL